MYTSVWHPSLWHLYIAFVPDSYIKTTFYQLLTVHGCTHLFVGQNYAVLYSKY